MCNVLGIPNHSGGQARPVILFSFLEVMWFVCGSGTVGAGRFRDVPHYRVHCDFAPRAFAFGGCWWGGGGGVGALVIIFWRILERV
jgi:hypothetical protein